MTASYTRANKTCDKVDAQIWVVYYAFLTNLRIHSYRSDPAYVAPIESSVLAKSGKNKHVGGAGPANQNKAFKNRVIFPPEQK